MSSGQTRVPELLLQGWKMLGQSCTNPGCYLPLMQNHAGEVMCVGCDERFASTGEAVPQRSSTGSYAGRGVVIESESSSKVPEDDDEDWEVHFSRQDTEADKRQDLQSRRIGELLLSGWKMLETICPKPKCNVPIMQSRDGQSICVSCELLASQPAARESAPGPASARTAPAAPAASAVVSSADLLRASVVVDAPDNWMDLSEQELREYALRSTGGHSAAEVAAKLTAPSQPSSQLQTRPPASVASLGPTGSAAYRRAVPLVSAAPPAAPGKPVLGPVTRDERADNVMPESWPRVRSDAVAALTQTLSQASQQLAAWTTGLNRTTATAVEAVALISSCAEAIAKLNAV